MSRFRSTFKRSALDQDDRKQGRINLMAKSRKEKRGCSFAAQRNIVLKHDEEEFNDIADDPAADAANNENKFSQRGSKVEQKKTKDNVKLRFQKWKEEKEKQKLKELQMKSKSRLPFKAGAVHHTNKPLDIAPLHPIKNPFLNVKSAILMSATKQTAFQEFGKFQSNQWSSLPTFGSQHGASQRNEAIKEQAKVSTVKTFKARSQKTQPVSTKNLINTTSQTLKNEMEMQSTDTKNTACFATANTTTHGRVTRGSARTVNKIPGVRGKVQFVNDSPGVKGNIHQANKQTPGKQRIVQSKPQTPGTILKTQATYTPGARASAKRITFTPGTRGIFQEKNQTPGAREAQEIPRTPGTKGIQRKPQTPGAREAQEIPSTNGTKGMQRKPQTPGARGAQEIIRTPGHRGMQRKPQTPGARAAQEITRTPGTKGMQRKPQTPEVRAAQEITRTPGHRGMQRKPQTPGVRDEEQGISHTSGANENKEANVIDVEITCTAIQEGEADMEDQPTQHRSLRSQNNEESTLPVHNQAPTELKGTSTRSKRKSSVQKQSLHELKEYADIQDSQMLIDNEKEETHDCSYFRRILASTIISLETRCVLWEQEQERCGDDMTEIAHEQLLLATGMARLLIREKFAQFRGLIDCCENPSDTTTLCSDLQGFWDMIYLQVEDIDKKFKELETLKKHNWVPVIQKAAAKVVKKKVAVAKPKPAASKGPSKFRAFMAATRKNKESNEVSPKDKTKTAHALVNDKVTKNSPAVRRSLPRKSLSTPLKKIESPNVTAILSASRIAKSAGRKSFSLDISDKVNSPSASKADSSKSSKTKSVINISPRRGIIKKNELMSDAFKKSVIFTASIPEEKEEDQETHVMPVTRTYSQQHYSVSPVKDKFDALFVSSPLVSRKASLLYTPPGQDESQTNEISENIAPKSGLCDIPEEPSPKFVKHPTPYITKRRERKSRPIRIEETAVLNSPNLMQLDSPVSAGRHTRRSAATAKKVSATSNTPDLISWDSPNPGDTPKRRKSSRIPKN